jgi:hypothetical protein
MKSGADTGEASSGGVGGRSLHRVLKKNSWRKKSKITACIWRRWSLRAASRSKPLSSSWSSYEDTLEVLGAAIDLLDATTEGHSRLVCRSALEIAMPWAFPKRKTRPSPWALTCMTSGNFLSSTAFS